MNLLLPKGQRCMTYLKQNQILSIYCIMIQQKIWMRLKRLNYGYAYMKERKNGYGLVYEWMIELNINMNINEEMKGID